MSSTRNMSLTRHTRAAASVVLALVVATGLWAATATFSSAVVAPATVVVSGKAKQVQHREGGVIAAIKVREGDLVSAGTLLIQLDDTQPRSELAIQKAQLHALVARRARLMAELASATRIAPPADPGIDAADPTFSEVWESERSQFEARRRLRDGHKAQHSERIVQIEEQVTGRAAQLGATRRQLATARLEVEDLRPLRKKGLVTSQRFNSLERSLFSLEGDEARSVAEMASAKAQIVEIRTQLANIDREAAAEMAKDLRETEDKLVEVREKLIVTHDRLAKTRILAPASGIVHQMAISNAGGVAAPGEMLMQIVPQSERLMIEAKIERGDVDRAARDQLVRVRLTSFDRRTTPELAGHVMRISADAETDPKTNASFYKVEIALADGDAARLGGATLRPGMPAEAYLETGSRSPLEYFVKPLTDQLARAFKER